MGWNCSSNPLMLVDNVMLFAQIPKYRDFWNGFRKCCDFLGNLGAMASL